MALTIYCFKDKKLGSLSSHKFVYCLDIEQILAQLLADSASDSKLFECIASLSVVSNHISKELKDTLDARITNAFEFLDLPPTWSLFGKGIENNEIRNGKLIFERFFYSKKAFLPQLLVISQSDWLICHCR